MKSSIRLFPIDFAKPWWYIIVQQKWLAIVVFISVIIRDVFWALAPLLVAFTVEKGSWHFFALVCGLWLLVELNSFLQPVVNARFQLQCIHSIFYNAHLHLLTIDPQYQMKRSSGAVLAKIDRAARGYEDLLDQVTFEFISLFVGVVSMIIMLGRYSMGIVAVVCCFLLVIVGYGYYFVRYTGKMRDKDFIATDDDFRATAFENLAQIQLIRATFATEYMQNKITKKIDINSQMEKKLWISYITASRLLSVLYALSVLTILAYFMYCVQHGITSLTFAIGFILAYLQSTNKLTRILQPLRKYMRGYAAIKDLFESMPHFGEQTIPLFEVNKHVVPKNTHLTVLAQSLLFKYEAAHVFDHHALRIETEVGESNKLYGIIGPSGVGKTTLLSIVGGQLKPSAGTIRINDIDIYEVGDDTRRQLIALQGQTATSIRGSVRYNLLFGLPEHHGYSDEYLLDVMRRVGLEQVLRENQGLDTLLGEAALNISGGQRQRLNFAGLYLRACFYKPALILIDEPTSSLDEVSERAITQMIRELASHAITLVIAHRLNTLKDAVGLIDLSLLAESKEITIYTTDQLEQHSAYYRRLLQGVDELA
jgi:ATP-binding cassette subfamily B protein